MFQIYELARVMAPFEGQLSASCMLWVCHAIEQGLALVPALTFILAHCGEHVCCPGVTAGRTAVQDESSSSG